MIQRIAAIMYKYLFFFFPQTEHGGSPPHPWDYLAHFLASTAGVAILFLILAFPLKTLGVPPKATLLVGAGLMLVVGIVKEISDNNLGKTDMAGDMLGNILGIGLGIGAVLLVMFIIGKITN